MTLVSTRTDSYNPETKEKYSQIDYNENISQVYLAKLIYENVIESKEYNSARQKSNGVEAYKKTAIAIANDETNELSSADRDSLLVTAYLGGFMQADHELAELRKNSHLYSPEEEKRLSKELKEEYIIPFNHIVKNFINTHPNASINAAKNSLAALYTTVYRGEPNCLDIKGLKNRTHISPYEKVDILDRTLDGMRHELAAETLIDIGGYECDYNVSVEDDAKGIDMYVNITGIGWFGIDIKASKTTADKARKAHRRSHAIHTGLNDNDFTGSNNKVVNALTPPYSVLEDKSEDFCKRLEKMAQGSLQTGNKLVYSSMGRASMRF